MENKATAPSLAILVVGLIIGAIIGYGAVSSQISSLQEQMFWLRVEISAFEDQVLALKSDIYQKEADIEFLQNRIMGKEDEIFMLRGQIISLQRRLSSSDTLDTSDILGVYFSPDGGCEAQVIRWINLANSTVHVLIYSFTLDSIGDALIAANQRGIEVQVVFERQQITQYSEYQKLKAAGVPVRNDTNSDFMHDKVMIVDEVIVLTGSFNWSEHAEEDNDENLIVISSARIAEIYEEEFERIWNKSQGYEQPPPQESSIVISSVNYDAPGNDWENLNGEYAIFSNIGSADVDMTGWQLRDVADHVFIFPTFILQAGRSVTVYTGSGNNTQDSLYWGSDAPIWNNDHDTAYLHDENGELITTYGW